MGSHSLKREWWTDTAGRRVKDALMVLPTQVAKDIAPEWFGEGENIRVADAFVVDIMLNANGQTFDTLRRYAQAIDLDGIAIDIARASAVPRLAPPAA